MRKLPDNASGRYRYTSSIYSVGTIQLLGAAYFSIYKQKGTKLYSFKFMSHGEVIRGACDTSDAKTARKIEAAMRIENALANVGINRKKQTPTLLDYATGDFLTFVRINNKEKPNTVKYYEQSVGRLTFVPEKQDGKTGKENALPASPLALKRLDEIDEVIDITAYKGHLQELGYSVTTINCDLRALKRILNIARKAKVIREFCDIPQLPGANKRDFVLRENDEEEYLAACDPLQGDVASHMIDMGFRPEEIEQLSWPQIHDDSIVIFVGKGDGSRRTIEMKQRVIDILKRRALYDESLREDPHWVFPAPTKTGHINASSTKKQHAKAVEVMRQSRAFRAGVDSSEIRFWFVPYSLRHTAITRMAEDGLDTPALMYWAGHKDIGTTMKYVHLAAKEINRAVKDTRTNSKRAQVVEISSVEGRQRKSKGGHSF